MKDTLEVLYGGAAGPGKSWALLAEASRFVDEAPTKSLLIRRTFKDLAQPGGLMSMAAEWFKGTDAVWDGVNYTWKFPSRASITFGYLENENDHLRYQGGEYHMVGFDELTQLRENQYIYLFSRTRRLIDFDIPIRIRAATNPGGPGHEWVRKRWNLPKGPLFPDNVTRKFVPASLDDNPHLDQEQYKESLERLKGGATDITYRQLAEGDWSAMGTGGFFDPRDFKLIDWADVPPAQHFRTFVRYWDFGATEPSEFNPDPDYTVGLKIGVTTRGQASTTNPLAMPDYYILDITRDRLDPGGVERLITATARRDGLGIPQWIEQERGSAGKQFVYHIVNNVLPGYMVRPLYATGDKETRAKNPAARAREGRIYVVEGEWTDAFLAECGAFPDSAHDDQVDALSGGMISLEREHGMAAMGKAYRVSKKDERPDHRRPKPGKLIHLGY